MSSVEGRPSKTYVEPLLHTYSCYVRSRRKHMTRWQVGSLPEQSLAEVWAVPEYVAFRDRVRRFDFPPCTDCLRARGVVRCP